MQKFNLIINAYIRLLLMNIFILYSINYGFVIKPTGSMKKLQGLDFSVKSESSAKSTEEMRATIYAGKVIQGICLCVFNIFYYLCKFFTNNLLEKIMMTNLLYLF